MLFQLLRDVRRLPVWWWAAALAVAASSGALVAHDLRAAHREAEHLGGLVRTDVAARDLQVGDIVGPGDVVARSWPRSLLAGQPGPVVGRTVTVPALRGAPVTSANLSPAGTSGVRALLRSGESAIALGTSSEGAPVHIGDEVDVYAAGPSDAAATPGPNVPRPVASGRVVQVADRSVTVAVRQSQAPALASASSDPVVLAVKP